MSFAIDYQAPVQGPQLGLAVAIRDLTRAWLRYSASRPVLGFTHGRGSGELFLNQAQELGLNLASGACLALPAEDPLRSLATLSALLVPDPALAEIAWRRALLPAEKRPALCGIVHSLSGDQVARAFAATFLAPVASCDALICPSQALKAAVLRLWEMQSERFSAFLGPLRPCPLETPVIPLGIETDKFAALAAPDKRQAQREALGASEDEVVVLFLGRLNFATKAHPFPLLEALAQASRLTAKKLRLVLYGYYFPQEEMQPRFEKLLASYQGRLACEVVLQDDPRFPDGLWAGADIFTSLIDNVQESFGLTPIEAMAAGLPSVLSDWDGYRDSVRDGQEGFLIPTFAPPAGCGEEIALAFASRDHYGHYLSAAAQASGFDIRAAAQAFAALASDADKRRLMAERGRKRARDFYDWRVIIPAYEELLGHLAQRRQALAGLPQMATPPFYPDPYTIFSSFPSAPLAPADKLLPLAPAHKLEEILTHDMNVFAPDSLLPEPLIRQLYENLIAQGGVEISALLALAPASEQSRLMRTLGWLLKTGLCARS